MTSAIISIIFYFSILFIFFDSLFVITLGLAIVLKLIAVLLVVFVEYRKDKAINEVAFKQTGQEEKGKEDERK